MDIVGALQPIKDRDNCYIHTFLDYASRYPEATALTNIDSQRVAKALIDNFSWMGVPEEMLTDMGNLFTSSLMSEVNRFTDFHQTQSAG